MSKLEEKAEKASSVRAGQQFEEQGIIFKVVERQPYTDAAGKSSYMISYRLIDGKEVTTVAHLWVGRSQDLRPEIKKCVEYYIEMRDKMRGIPLSP